MDAAHQHQHKAVGGISASTLLKDIMRGLMLGFIIMLATIFLDYHNVIHLESAHHTRATAFRVLNDQDATAIIEDTSNLKFIKYSEYELMMKDVGNAGEEIAFRKEEIERRKAEADALHKEVESIQAEHKGLMEKANELFEFEKFCPECYWQGRTTCETRQEFLERHYKVGRVESMVTTMKTTSCKKQASTE